MDAKPRAVGLNHIALEVGDIDEALAFYGRLFGFELRGKSDTMAFIDLGDQFIALQKGRRQPADDGRHFGRRIARDRLKRIDGGQRTADGVCERLPTDDANPQPRVAARPETDGYQLQIPHGAVGVVQQTANRRQQRLRVLSPEFERFLGHDSS